MSFAGLARYEFRIPQNLRLAQSDERIPEQVLVAPVVVSPFQFVEVGAEMLDRHMMGGTSFAGVMLAPKTSNQPNVGCICHEDALTRGSGLTSVTAVGRLKLEETSGGASRRVLETASRMGDSQRFADPAGFTRP